MTHLAVLAPVPEALVLGPPSSFAVAIRLTLGHRAVVELGGGLEERRRIVSPDSWYVNSRRQVGAFIQLPQPLLCSFPFKY